MNYKGMPVELKKIYGDTPSEAWSNLYKEAKNRNVMKAEIERSDGRLYIVALIEVESEKQTLLEG